MSFKGFISYITGSYNYDRRGEYLIKKAVRLYHKGGKFNQMRAMRIHNKLRKNFSCIIYPRATIGKNVYFAHAYGVAIGKTSIIGDNCSIYPGATLGANIKGDMELRDAGETRWHPKIGNECTLGLGCKVIGRVEIGDDVIIAANALVTKDVPPHSVVKNINEIRPKRPEEYGDPYHNGLRAKHKQVEED